LHPAAKDSEPTKSTARGKRARREDGVFFRGNMAKGGG